MSFIFKLPEELNCLSIFPFIGISDTCRFDTAVRSDKCLSSSFDNLIATPFFTLSPSRSSEACLRWCALRKIKLTKLYLSIGNTGFDFGMMNLNLICDVNIYFPVASLEMTHKVVQILQMCSKMSVLRISLGSFAEIVHITSNIPRHIKSLEISADCFMDSAAINVIGNSCYDTLTSLDCYDRHSEVSIDAYHVLVLNCQKLKYLVDSQDNFIVKASDYDRLLNVNKSLVYIYFDHGRNVQCDELGSVFTKYQNRKTLTLGSGDCYFEKLEDHSIAVELPNRSESHTVNEIIINIGKVYGKQCTKLRLSCNTSVWFEKTLLFQYFPCLRCFTFTCNKNSASLSIDAFISLPKYCKLLESVTINGCCDFLTNENIIMFVQSCSNLKHIHISSGDPYRKSFNACRLNGDNQQDLLRQVNALNT